MAQVAALRLEVPMAGPEGADGYWEAEQLREELLRSLIEGFKPGWPPSPLLLCQLEPAR